ncbi:SAF domain-containing protein [Brachybacterium kimchii]|uniref:SAF domain-containing protein n=1 Tax=Brachybacterium kimchii TaxID=2942909 RepID=A0ABY4NBB0_9MICO|nr:SAF domain-containing protein [Brachybacterium kimchii]UQN31821.1 SAF domain-containing protein [Brachybacterium kimchii]
MALLPKRKPKNAEETAEKDEQPAVPKGAATSGTPLRQRRRPTLIAAGVALIIVGALGAYWTVDRLSTTTQVVVAADSVPEGQVLEADDLLTSDVNVPSGTAVVAGGDLDSLVGKRTTSALEKGEIVAPGSTSAAAFPATDTAVVGIKVAAGQYPSNDLNPGSAVQVIGTPREGDDPPSGDAPVIAGTVHAIGSPTQDGGLTVDILVSNDQAATLASLSATGRISLVLVPKAE